MGWIFFELGWYMKILAGQEIFVGVIFVLWFFYVFVRLMPAQGFFPGGCVIKIKINQNVVHKWVLFGSLYFICGLWADDSRPPPLTPFLRVGKASPWEWGSWRRWLCATGPQCHWFWRIFWLDDFVHFFPEIFWHAIYPWIQRECVG